MAGEVPRFQTASTALIPTFMYTTQPKHSALTEDALDALVVGAGLAGMYLLHQLRTRGLSVKVFEAGGDLGGVWHWNRYPGLRLDSEFFIYQFLMDDLWKGFTWRERFPAREEVLDYVHYVDRKLDLRRDMLFNTRVVSAQFDIATDRWAVTTDSGVTVHPRFLLLCTGQISKPHIPPFKGLDTFKGACHHSARFPEDSGAPAMFDGKRVGVVGNGASGVQIIQSAAPLAGHLTVFQRTPQFALPLKQSPVTPETHREMTEGSHPSLPQLLRARFDTFTGSIFQFRTESYNDASLDERSANFEKLWAIGGFELCFGSYKEVFLDPAANHFLYSFWRQKVISRIHDPVVREKLAPAITDHPIGAKQFPCLEQTYFEAFNQPNVTLVDVQENPIDEITPVGVKLRDGTEHHLDVLVLATGFGHITSAIKDIEIRGITDGAETLREKWDRRLDTYLGVASAGYPNLFFPCGPHAPTPLVNAPSLVESQGAWIVDCIDHMQKKGLTRIEPTAEAEEGWGQLVQAMFSASLLGQYTRTLTPGGEVGRAPAFCGGLSVYIEKCRQVAEGGYEGFNLSKEGLIWMGDEI